MSHFTHVGYQPIVKTPTWTCRNFVLGCSSPWDAATVLACETFSAHYELITAFPSPLANGSIYFHTIAVRSLGVLSPLAMTRSLSSRG